MFPDLLGSKFITTTVLGIIMRNNDQSIEVKNEATALYKKWLTEREAAEYLNVSTSFLSKAIVVMQKGMKSLPMFAYRRNASGMTLINSKVG